MSKFFSENLKESALICAHFFDQAAQLRMVTISIVRG
jgi:hypothetical protein